MKGHVLLLAISASLMSPAAAQDAKPCNPCEFRISQNVAEGLLIHRVDPDFPADAGSSGLWGQVGVRFFIDKQGRAVGVSGLNDQSIQTSFNPRVMDAAEKAVRQWFFKPYLLNGEPIEVESLVRLPYNFSPQNPSQSETPKAAPPLPSSPSPAPSPTPEAGPKPMKIRVSPGVAESLVAHKVQPIYPKEAKEKRIEGDVVIKIVIGRDGEVKSLKPSHGESILMKAAMEAVQQWKYRPYLLDGQPVEVESQVRISFHL
jgi:TonB family protein